MLGTGVCVDGNTSYCCGFCLFGENEWMLLSTLKHAEPFSFGDYCLDRQCCGLNSVFPLSHIAMHGFRESVGILLREFIAAILLHPSLVFSRTKPLLFPVSP